MLQDLMLEVVIQVLEPSLSLLIQLVMQHLQLGQLRAILNLTAAPGSYQPCKATHWVSPEN